MMSCLLFVLVSFAIVVPYAIFNKLLAKSELHALCSFFNYMQQKAIALQKDLSVLFEPEKQKYTAENTTYDLPAGINFFVFPGLQGPPATPTHIITQPITYKQNTIIFYKNGVVSAGTMYLFDTNYKIQYAITNAVHSISYFRLYQYDAGKWNII